MQYLAQVSEVPSRELGGNHWFYLAVPLIIYAIVVLALFGYGRSDEKNLFKFFFAQISDSLRRATGIAGWAAAGVLTALLMLLIAVIGFYWDVAYHIDLGRDAELFTVPHVMILVGLGGIGFAAAIATLFATIDKAETGFGVAGLRVPWSALGLAALSIGGVAAFPIDNLWHEAYGLDVTLWSPSHLQLVAGGSLATIAGWLMIAEALPSSRPNLLGRGIHALVGGAALVGVSTFQGEFDFGVPQFRLVYFPILVMAAAGLVLTLARLALGPWGAVKVLIAYLIVRAGVGGLIDGLGHTYPQFPLYLAPVAAVEGAGAILGTDKKLRFVLAAGALIGTVGLAGELALAAWLAGFPTTGSLIAQAAILGLVAAVGAALLGGGLSRAFATTSGSSEPIPAALMALGAAGLIAALLYPLPRNVGDVQATILLERQGDQGLVTVRLDPADAAEGATLFGVGAWQGGGVVSAGLNETEPGVYVADKPVPVTGSWKSMVTLERGDELMAAPIYMPADPEIGASEVPAVPERTVSFVQNTEVLLREAHDGPAWPSIVAFTGLGTLVAIWSGLFGLAAWKAGTTKAPPPPPPATRAGAVAV